MMPSLVSRAQTRRRTDRSPGAVPSWAGLPLTFFLAGFVWLALSFVLGTALILGLVYGTPLPQWLKPSHVHGALVGGILQLTIGSLIFWLARSPDSKASFPRPRPTLFFSLNAATGGLLFSFAVSNTTIAGIAGVLLTGAVLSLAKAAWIHFGKATGIGGIYRIVLVALLCGLAAGIAMSFRLTSGYYAYARLAHIHTIVLGLTVAFFVASHQLLPTLSQTRLGDDRIARLGLWSLPVGFVLLIGGFLTSLLWLQIAAGCLLFAAIALCTGRLVAAWLRTKSVGTAATDHVLTGACFLVMAVGAALAVSANALTNPPVLPIGSLHLMAYTHLAFIGFMTQIICGGLSFFVPELLAASRVQNGAKREVYRAKLDAIMNRWRAPQLLGMSLGTMALCILAALTWSMSLSSPYVQGTVWIAAGLLVVSLAVFAAKLAWAVGLRPS